MVPVNRAEPLTCAARQGIGVNGVAFDGGCSVAAGVGDGGTEKAGRDAAVAVPPIHGEAGRPTRRRGRRAARGAAPDSPARRPARDRGITLVHPAGASST